MNLVVYQRVIMMRKLLTTLLAGWLMAVTVGGWCCHLANASVLAQPTDLATVSLARTTCCDGCHIPSRGSEPAPVDENHAACHGICKSLPEPKVEPRDELVLRFDLAIVEVKSVGAHAPSIFDGPGCFWTVACKLPLRLHLLHQILLI
jgi:hypothetical protein